MSNIFESNQMNSGNKVIYTVLAILLIAGMGVGGYYLGWFLDRQAANKQALLNAKNPQTYNISDLGIKFVFPGNWASIPKTVTGNSTLVGVESPSGSQFMYVNNSSSVTNDLTLCDEDKPEGDTATGAVKCTFITGTFKFARFQDSAKNIDGGEYWGIAVPGENTNPKTYLHNTLDGFYFISKSSADLTALDNIMKTVVRTK